MATYSPIQKLHVSIGETFEQAKKSEEFLESFITKEKIDMSTKQVSFLKRTKLNLRSKDKERGADPDVYGSYSFEEVNMETPYIYDSVILSDLDAFTNYFENPTMGGLVRVTERVAERITEVAGIQKRYYNKQIAQLLENGVINLDKGGSLNFHRDPSSIVVNGSSDLWDHAESNIFEQLDEMVEFLEQKGKTNATEHTLVMSRKIFNAMLSNGSFKEQADNRRYSDRVELSGTKKRVAGTFKGVISTSSARLDVVVYNGYEDVNGVPTKYLSENRCYLIAGDNHLTLHKAGVPTLPREFMSGQRMHSINNGIILRDYRDAQETTYGVTIAQAPLPVLGTPDRVFTREVLE